MTKTQLTDQTTPELEKLATTLRRQIHVDKLNVAAGKNKNLRTVFNSRHKLARVLTVLAIRKAQN